MQHVIHRLIVKIKSFFFIKNLIEIKGSYEEIRGTWTFYEGPRTFDKNYDCSKFTNFTTKFQVKLLFPNTAVDQDGNTGFWTLIYNQVFNFLKKKFILMNLIIIFY